jgi:hypothetical protein
MSEAATFLSHPIQVRSAMNGGTKWLNVAVTQIVAEHNNEVRWLNCQARGVIEKQNTAQQKKAFDHSEIRKKWSASIPTV